MTGNLQRSDVRIEESVKCVLRVIVCFDICALCGLRIEAGEVVFPEA